MASGGAAPVRARLSASLDALQRSFRDHRRDRLRHAARAQPDLHVRSCYPPRVLESRSDVEFGVYGSRERHAIPHSGSDQGRLHFIDVFVHRPGQPLLYLSAGRRPDRAAQDGVRPGKDHRTHRLADEDPEPQSVHRVARDGDRSIRAHGGPVLGGVYRSRRFQSDQRPVRV